MSSNHKNSLESSPTISAGEWNDTLGPATMEMISAGMTAYNEFDPKKEDPEALVFAIIYRAFEVAKRYREAVNAAAHS